jgi:flagella basal body P-ring formation protein FlgA
MRLIVAFLLGAALFGAEADVALPPGDRLHAQALAYAQAEAAGRDGAYTFRVLGTPILPRASKGELTFEPAHLSRADLAGRFYISFNAVAEGRVLGMVRVDLEGRWKGQLTRFRTALPRRAVPEPGQLESFDFEGTPPAGAVREIPEGYRLRLPVTQGKILTRMDLEATPLILVGDPVRLELVNGFLSITVDATARSSGAAGEKVRLEMPTSHRSVQAVVMGPGEARVTWPDSK